MTQPPIPVGFNYAQALLEIRKRMTYEEIAAFIGYENASSVAQIIKGRIPNHPQGQAIWVLYVELFDKKPPMTTLEAAGVSSIAIWQRRRGPIAA